MIIKPCMLSKRVKWFYYNNLPMAACLRPGMGRVMSAVRASSDGDVHRPVRTPHGNTQRTRVAAATRALASPPLLLTFEGRSLTTYIHTVPYTSNMYVCMYVCSLTSILLCECSFNETEFSFFPCELLRKGQLSNRIIVQT